MQKNLVFRLSKRGNLLIYRRDPLDGRAKIKLPLRIYQAWPPRAWGFSKEGKLRGRPFDLDLNQIEVLIRAYNSPKRKEERETARIWAAGYRRGVSKDLEDPESCALTLLAREKSSIFERWMEPIPRELRRVLRKFRGFSGKFSGRVLHGCYQIPEFRELVMSNAALGLGAMNKIDSLRPKGLPLPVPKQLGMLRRYSRMKRVDLFREIWGGNPGKAAVRNLRKLPISQVNSGGSFPIFARRLDHPLCGHLPVLSLVALGAIAAIENQRPLIGRGAEETLSFHLWDKLARDGRKRTKAGNIRQEGMVPYQNIQDILRMVEDQIRRGGEIPPFRSPFRTEEEIQRYHDQMVYLVTGEDLEEVRAKEKAPFSSPPPLPGEGSITPLCSPLELKEEGKKMHHCVGSYAVRVEERESFIYHVQLDDRETATLELLNIPSRGWVLGQLHGACNKAPSEKLRRTVQEWYSRTSRGGK